MQHDFLQDATILHLHFHKSLQTVGSFGTLSKHHNFPVVLSNHPNPTCVINVTHAQVSHLPINIAVKEGVSQIFADMLHETGSKLFRLVRSTVEHKLKSSPPFLPCVRGRMWGEKHD